VLRNHTVFSGLILYDNACFMRGILLVTFLATFDNSGISYWSTILQKLILSLKFNYNI